MTHAETGGRRHLRVTTSDGWELDVLRISAHGPPRAVAVLGHAMMVDRRSMDRPKGSGLASTLAAAGIEVFLPDVRGRGDSGPRAEDGGRWGYDDLVRRDLPAVVEAVREACPGLPLTLVGHSLCGHVSAAAAGTGAYPRPPEAHVLLSANAWLPSLEARLGLRLRKTLATWSFLLLSWFFGRFPSRLLRMGPVDEARPYADDIASFWRSDSWGSQDGQHDYLAGMAQVSGRILSVLGAADTLLAHPSGARAWAECFGAGRATIEVVGRGRWGLDFDPDHMSLVTDPRSRPLWERVAAWILDEMP